MKLSKLIILFCSLLLTKAYFASSAVVEEPEDLYVNYAKELKNFMTLNRGMVAFAIPDPEKTFINTDGDSLTAEDAAELFCGRLAPNIKRSLQGILGRTYPCRSSLNFSFISSLLEKYSGETIDSHDETNHEIINLMRSLSRLLGDYLYIRDSLEISPEILEEMQAALYPLAPVSRDNSLLRVIAHKGLSLCGCYFSSSLSESSISARMRLRIL